MTGLLLAEPDPPGWGLGWLPLPDIAAVIPAGSFQLRVASEECPAWLPGAACRFHVKHERSPLFSLDAQGEVVVVGAVTRGYRFGDPVDPELEEV